jgi:hypothetical protein
MHKYGVFFFIFFFAFCVVNMLGIYDIRGINVLKLNIKLKKLEKTLFFHFYYRLNSNL